MRKQKNNNSTIQNLFFFPSPINELIYVHFGLAQNTLLEFRGSEISVEPTTERKGSKWRSTGTQIWASALSKSDHMQPHRLVKSVTPCFLLLCTKTRCVFTDTSFSTSTGFNTLFPLAYTHLTPQPYLCQENCWYGHRLKCIEENNPPRKERRKRVGLVPQPNSLCSHTNCLLRQINTQVRMGSKQGGTVGDDTTMRRKYVRIHSLGEAEPDL